MARKKFTKEIKGLDALFSEKNEREDVETEISKKKVSKKKKLKSDIKSNLVKTSFNMDIEVYEKLKACSYKNRYTSSKLLEQCIKEYFVKVGEEEVEKALEMYRNAN